jgi:NlpC/P60 family putative phage cell wall peptidase
VTRDDVVAAARAWLGTPYRHQAATLGAGCDCLGLLRGVWRSLYGSDPMAVPAYRADWRDGRHAGELLAAAERLLAPAAGELRPGQIILFRLGLSVAPRHCGIAVGPDRFIHAQERLGVIEAALGGWQTRIAAQYEFPGVQY